MSTKTVKPVFATRNFKDAGSGRAFAGGAEVTDATDGEIENYRAAGLVTDERPTPAAATDKAA